MKPYWLRTWHSLLSGASAPTPQRRAALSFERLEPRQLLAITNFPLLNASFEAPTLSLANSFHPTVSSWNPTAGLGTTFEAPWVPASPAPHGDQFAWGDLDNWVMSQNGPTIAANTRYILSVDLFPLTSGTNRAQIYLQDKVAFTNLAKAEYQPSFSPTTQDFQLPAGQWTTVKIGFNSAQFAAYIGRGTQIYIGGSRLAVDNVKLTVDDSVHDFYISSSSGSATNDGFTAGAAWNSFASLAPYLPLQPGERVLLKAGDTFTGELNLRGKGTLAAPIELGSYGAGANPVIVPNNIVSGIGVTWNNASHVKINKIDVEQSKLGVYLRYEWTDSGSTNVTVENCNFRDFPDPTLDPSAHNYEYSWSAGIWVGGQPWNTAEFATRLNNLTVRNITADNIGVLFGTGWYYPGIYKSRITNFLMEDCLATNCLNGSFQLFYVDGGIVRRVHAIAGGGQDTWSGLTMGFAQSSKNIVIEDCEFSYLDRAQAGDGSGMDFEGNNENIIFRNNTIHSNDGSALLILSTDGPNINLTITDNVFYDNAKDPWNSTINSEIQGSGAVSTGVISNNGIYRGNSSINFLSTTNSNWSGFTISNNRQLDYNSVKNRPTWWDFATAGDLAGWGGFNHWSNAAVVGGALVGQSSGVDPYVQSPPTWINTTLSRYVWVRMSQTAGNFAQLFYITETDPNWDGNKRIDFPIIADGVMRDYFIDVGGNVNTKGVITQLRIDPTVVSGSDIAIDFVRVTNSTELNQSPPLPALPDPSSLTFTSIASEDGHILESAQNSGAGGTVTSSGNSFRLGDDASNRAYRQFLSFDTSSLPDNAIVTQATIGITRIGNPTGSIPIGVANSTWGDILVDLAAPGFGTSTLAAADWQSSATKLAVSKFAWPAYSSNMTIYSRLEDPDESLINRTGKTQFRIRYQNDDDNDGIADYMPYATGDHATASLRPTLTIQYILQPPGDYNANGYVDTPDYEVWKSTFGSTTDFRADGNSDGAVDAADYAFWRDRLPGAAAAISTIAVASASVAADSASTTADQLLTPQQINLESPSGSYLAEQSARPTRLRAAMSQQVSDRTWELITARHSRKVSEPLPVSDCKTDDLARVEEGGERTTVWELIGKRKIDIDTWDAFL